MLVGSTVHTLHLLDEAVDDKGVFPAGDQGEGDQLGEGTYPRKHLGAGWCGYISVDVGIVYIVVISF